MSDTMLKLAAEECAILAAEVATLTERVEGLEGELFVAKAEKDSAVAFCAAEIHERNRLRMALREAELENARLREQLT